MSELQADGHTVRAATQKAQALNDNRIRSPSYLIHKQDYFGGSCSPTTVQDYTKKTVSFCQLKTMYSYIKLLYHPYR